MGLGFGRYGFLPAFRCDPRSEIVALCGTSIERAGKYAAELGVPRAYGDYRAMIESGDLDVVAIATPPTVQPAISALASTHGLSVLCTKPMASSLEEARLMQAAAVQAGQPNMIDFLFPEIEAWAQAWRLLQEGMLGRVRHAVVHWTMESYDVRRMLETWKTNATLGGGVLHHFASHTFHYLEWFLGRLECLSASLTQSPDLSRPGDNLAVLAARFASGVSASVTVCNAAFLGTSHRLEFYGSEGTLVLSNVTPGPVRGFRLFVGRRGRHQALEEVPVVERLTLSDDVDTRVAPLSRLIERFLDWIETRTPAHPSLEDGLRVQMLIDAAQRSAHGRAWVNV